MEKKFLFHKDLYERANNKNDRRSTCDAMFAESVIIAVAESVLKGHENFANKGVARIIFVGRVKNLASATFRIELVRMLTSYFAAN